ncbi:hypothetical protein OIU77_000656 [Salix suchowensis]|uniref:Uncharacterized protein n=1 Tax=Salix suchowensis TaxID=1278906 RepID=A0ABQ9B9A1_9ROSI|nr:hypothetical protein OIU77_000656 [Salix suchowensis]
MKCFKTGFHSSIDIPMQIQRKQPSQILLDNNIIIKEDDLFQKWIDLRDVKSEVIEQRHVLRVPQFRLNLHILIYPKVVGP